MIIAAIMMGSFVGTLLASIGFFAFGVGFLSAVAIYLVSSLLPAVIICLNSLAQMASDVEQSISTSSQG